MKQRALAALAASALCLLITACGLSGYKESTLIIEKSGSVREIIVEDAGTEAMTKEALESFVTQSLSDFNETFDAREEAVTLEKLSYHDSSLKLELHYESAEAYRAFNSLRLECLSAGALTGEAAALILKDAQGNEAAPESLQGYNAVITDFAMHIVVPGKVVYYGGSAAMDGKDSVNTADSLSVIIYK